MNMENYKKGINVDPGMTKEDIAIHLLPDNFLWLKVSGGSKIRNLLTYALAEFPKRKLIVWSGSGPAVGKTVSCSEIMKKKYGNSLHQITKISYRTVEEYWDPLIKNLGQLVVKRKIPCVHIVLSINPLDENELGYQAPTNNIAKDLKALEVKG